MEKRSGRVARVTGIEGDNRAMVILWCPGCNDAHQLWVVDPDKPAPVVAVTWQWNGDLDSPTFQPSLLTQAGPGTRCHSYIRDGVWEFLGDCEHALVSTHVPCVELPEYLRV